MGFMEGFVDGFVRAFNEERNDGRIEQLCAALGWAIDERDGDTVGLNFKCPVRGRRTVYINSGDEALVFFFAPSAMILSQHSEHVNFIAGYALFSNANTRLGKWQASFNKRDDIVLSLTYTALGEGLNAAALKYICSTMSAEASNFDARMKERGIR
ncbi:MAG TPA: hypothetical protein VG826_05530 [Pirellulales bacterium]|nr:hypothetical protein [Pirellulales bacterium]